MGRAVRGALLATGLLAACAVTRTAAAPPVGGLVYRGALPTSSARPVPLPAAPGQAGQHDYEAQAQAAPDGTIWATANILLNDDRTSVTGRDSRGSILLSGADVWVSRDGGRTFRWVAAPFNPRPDAPGAGGQDADITVAPDRNASRRFTVSVVTLNLLSSQLAWTTDDGASWSSLPLVGAMGQDRPWLAADGPCLVHVVSRQIGASAPVLETVDTCTGKPLGIAPLVPVGDTYRAAGQFNNLLAKPVVDGSPGSRFRGSLYVPMSQCALPADDAVTFASGDYCQGAGIEHLLGVSRDHGKTMAVHRVALQQADRFLPAIWPSNVATDALGRVFFVWHDRHDAWFQVSRDGGQSFSKPARLNTGLGAAAYPTVAAQGDGQVVVAAFVADRIGDVNDLAVFGDPASGGTRRASWRLVMWRSHDAGRSFQRGARTGVVHRGVVCTSGTGCTVSNGDRALFDDFGLVLTRGGAAVAVLDEDAGTASLAALRTGAVRLPR